MSSLIVSSGQQRSMRSIQETTVPSHIMRSSRSLLTLGLCCVLGMTFPPAAAADREPADERKETHLSSVAASGNDAEPESRADPGEEESATDKPSKGFWSNIVPVPIFITEPAVGKGLGVALGYFHPSPEGDANPDKPIAVSGRSFDDEIGIRHAQPTVTGVAAGYTANDTKFFAIGHSRTFNEDHVRLNVAAGWADVFADIYVLGIPFEFNIEGYLFYADTRVRFGDSDFFWGVGVTALDAENEFLLELPEGPSLGFLATDFLDIGLTGRLMYDSRNDPLFPSSGQRVDLTVAMHDKSVGADFDYVHSTIKALTFHPVGERTVVSGRIEAQQVTGDPPFFAVPYVGLRGIPALRYQGKRVAVAEAEVRYRFAPRWTALAFAGLGWRDRPPQKDDESIYNFGVGGRFKVLKDREVWLGLDIARGPEDVNWYIQVGQAW